MMGLLKAERFCVFYDIKFEYCNIDYSYIKKKYNIKVQNCNMSGLFICGCDFKKDKNNYILIEKDLSLKVQMYVFWHEIGHYIQYYNNLKYSDKKTREYDADVIGYNIALAVKYKLPNEYWDIIGTHNKIVQNHYIDCTKLDIIKEQYLYD